MKTITKVLAGAIATVTMIAPYLSPALLGWEGHHPEYAQLIGGVIALLALLHNPKDPTKAV